MSNNIQDLSSCLFDVADKLTDAEYKNMYELLDKINTENEELDTESVARHHRINDVEEKLKEANIRNVKLEDKVDRFKKFNHFVSQAIFSFEANGIGNGMRTKLRDIFNSKYHIDSDTMSSEYDTDMKNYKYETGERFEWHLYPRMAVGIKPVKKKVKK